MCQCVCRFLSLELIVTFFNAYIYNVWFLIVLRVPEEPEGTFCRMYIFKNLVRSTMKRVRERERGKMESSLHERLDIL